ncbi:MAG: FxsA family protein [Dehalococcoidales bacterium]|jgi:UPF0716 protein FxsA
MLLKILGFFALLLAIEIIILAVVVRFLGITTAIVIIAATALLGVFVFARIGRAKMNRLRLVLAGNALPEEGILNTVLLFVAGIFLIAPGIIGDIVGILLLVPYSRSRVISAIRKMAEKLISRGQVGAARIGDDHRWPR